MLSQGNRAIPLWILICSVDGYLTDNAPSQIYMASESLLMRMSSMLQNLHWCLLHYQCCLLLTYVSDAIRMNPVCKPELATDSCLDKLASSWLINTRDRGGGRNHRYQQSAERHRQTQHDQWRWWTYKPRLYCVLADWLLTVNSQLEVIVSSELLMLEALCLMTDRTSMKLWWYLHL